MPTTWSTTDKVANTTLSNGNLTVAWGATTGLIRCADRVASGKYYFEVTINTGGAGASDAIGICSGTVAVTTSNSGVNSPVGTCWVLATGSIYSDATLVGATLGSIAAGSVVCVAFDATNRLAWFRVGAAGNWNGAAANNPATGTGGVAMSIGVAFDAYPVAWSALSGHQHTANFGATAYTGTAPAGFGNIPTGTSIVTNEVLTQAAIEQWATPPTPNANLTQIAVEQWASVNTSNPLMAVTQMALEQWASVALASTTQTRVWIMA